MKIKTLAILFSCVAAPVALFAPSDNPSPANDRKIEDAAKASYNYRTVLENHVKVKASDGVVTLTGTVQDKGDKDLAADTVENLPGVVSVDNQIQVDADLSRALRRLDGLQNSRPPACEEQRQRHQHQGRRHRRQRRPERHGGQPGAEGTHRRPTPRTSMA